MPKIRLQIQILAAMLLGVGAGLFFGELCASLDAIGTAFIMLLKMSVLPYMATGLMHALGSLSLSTSKRLLRQGLIFFPLFCLVVIASVFAISLTFPALQTPLFHSHLSQSADSKLDLLKLFIPINPFHALANNIIPAIVLFSLFFGIALMRVSNKAHLLQSLETINDTLISITRLVTRFSPVGVFALIASATGTLSFEHLAKIELYLIAYLGAVLVLSFWILPTMVYTFTGIPRRELLRAIEPAVLMGFTTGNNLVALPYLIEGLEDLANRHQLEDKEAHGTIASIVPLAYNFPTGGNLLTMLFILFLGFFYGVQFDFLDHLRLIGFGLPALFGAAVATVNACSFLLDTMRLPVDGLSLFFETLSITRNLQAVISLTGMATVTTLITFACAGKVRFQAATLLRSGLQMLLGLGLLVTILAWLMPSVTVSPPIFSSLRLAHQVTHRVLEDDSMPPPSPPAELSTLERIRNSGTMRVGYAADATPFSYFNKHEELVGFDIALAHQLAQNLGVEIDFIPFEYLDLESRLQREHFDLAVGAVSVNPERLGQIAFSTPYSTQERVLVVPDHHRHEFFFYAKLSEREDLRIAVLAGSSLHTAASQLFPLAEIIPIDHPNDFLTSNTDAMLWTKAESITWSLMHPTYAVVIPSPVIGYEHYALALGPESRDLKDYVNYCLHLKKLDGFVERNRDRWVYGKVDHTEPRWSVIRDVLHWID